jgi:hypothetical protein
MIDSAVIEGVDYVVHHRRLDTAITPPSRLVKINDEGEMVVLRG